MEHSCTIYRTSEIISKKWTLLIILSIYKGNTDRKRYSELKSSLKGITPKVLSQRLKELEKEGIILKEIDSGQVPVKTYYSLSESGKDLVGIIKQIKRWGLTWRAWDEECQATACRRCDKSI